MPRDDSTTSISGYPQPVKSWHMVISILCVDVCTRGILHTSFTPGASIEAQATEAACSTVGTLDFAGRSQVHTLADLPGISTKASWHLLWVAGGPTCEVLADVLHIGFANESHGSHTGCFHPKAI